MASKMNFVVKSMVKGAISKGKMHSSSDVADALNAYIGWTLEQAVKRAKANGRKTVRGHDILIMK